MDKSELAAFKKMVYAGKATICWFVTRDQVKRLIKMGEELHALQDAQAKRSNNDMLGRMDFARQVDSMSSNSGETSGAQ